MAGSRSALRDWLQNAAARTIIGVALLLPYRFRVWLVGKAVSLLVAPLAGWNRRIRLNLEHAMPGLSAREVKAIQRGVTDNVGRTLIEIYSGEDYVARTRASTIEGPGVDAMNEARDSGRPIVLVTAHLGNYDAVRGKLSREGFPMAALYRPMDNTAFNEHYVRAISTIASPVYPTDGRGIASLIRHLKGGGVIGIVADVASRRAPLLRFFDRTAHTPVSAAEWAVKYDALMVPVFGIRQSDGFTFRIHVAEPIEHGDPDQMMQAYNDVVEEIVREVPEQWFWVHRRWKLAAGVSEGVPPPE